MIIKYFMARHVNLCLLDPFYRFQQYLKYVVILNVMKHLFIGFCVKTQLKHINQYSVLKVQYINTLKPRHNGRHFADDIFTCIFLNGNVLISITSSLKFVDKVPMNEIPALIQIMAWRHPGDMPLSEPVMVSFPVHICITRLTWVNKICIVFCFGRIVCF